MFNPIAFPHPDARAFLREMFAATDKDGILTMKLSDNPEYFRMSWTAETLEEFLYRFDILRAGLRRTGEQIQAFGGAETMELEVLEPTLYKIWHFYAPDTADCNISQIRVTAGLLRDSGHREVSGRHREALEKYIAYMDLPENRRFPIRTFHPHRFLYRAYRYMLLAAQGDTDEALESEAQLLAREMALYHFCTGVIQ